MFTCRVVEGVAIMFAPLGADSRFPLYDGFAQSVIEVHAPARGA